jgi:hypothetical protein
VLVAAVQLGHVPGENCIFDALGREKFVGVDISHQLSLE